MIDALFGSKTRVKLLHLFLNNPGQSFYVREITRKVGEQINSVRRELSNMLDVGIITSDSADNKLYYQVNQRYEHYVSFRSIFSGEPLTVIEKIPADSNIMSGRDGYIAKLKEITGIRIAILAGVLVEKSTSAVDILLVGSPSVKKVQAVIKQIENNEGRELNYSVLSYDDFYYRWSVRDKFVMSVLMSDYIVAIDTDNILKAEKKGE